MKNIYLNIFKINNKNLSKAVDYLKRKQLIGVPTETVYGLAGDAYSSKAVKKIYLLKNRPLKNPLIIHYFNLDQLKKDVELNDSFYKLYKKFCPGPITFVLKKKKKSLLSAFATANLKTVAVRIPENKTIRKILKILNFPLAIPSANKSTQISPVSAKDVASEFSGSLKFILDGGSCKIGLESTVIDLTSKAKILRPGLINPSDISRVLNKETKVYTGSKVVKSPGMLKRHYSPGIPMKLNQKKVKNNEAFIVFGKKYKKGKNIYNLSYKSNLNEAAKNLYKILRIIKNKKYKMICVCSIPQTGIGLAINDRLNRAAK
ncbi:L-threonylcarbamoyladenylate synthase [Pelagibacteraceae bacterium]|nr:L-threonylcarbamoyladenylate synthase [Pelagibacteraceae bacterium]|tara:strand:+ start:880 stop:1833 length:954 start_codon:yes stop_codon:yes gene_type:complete